jgi:CxxC motif-containing protein (DUF1111 family)
MFGSHTAATVLLVSLAIGTVPQASAGDPAAGRVLFQRTWTASQGLGPFFNERSCVACHALGGVGGAGPISKNVELLSVEVPGWIRAARVRRGIIDGPTSLQMNETLVQLEKDATKLHSGLKNGSAVLHTFGNDQQYSSFREALLRLGPAAGPKLSPKKGAEQAADQPVAEPRRLPGPQPIKRIEQRNVNLLLSGRNSTALFGAGIIDDISDKEFDMVVADQTLRYPNMAGRFLGRFGWRAQTKTLSQFVAGACTVELGLEVPHIDDADTVAKSIAVRRAAGSTATPNLGSATPEISVEEFKNLRAFVASIPAPTRLKPADVAQANRIEKGEQLFASIGCSVCHRPSLGDAVGIYSDLLVHEMGAELADSQPAPLQAFRREYYSSESGSLSESVDPRRLSEWRTAPLWGLADSAPYLHDGRASTVEQAILAHGGQAAASAAAYAALSAVKRNNLLEFLSTLVAPETPERMRMLADQQPPRPEKPEPVVADPREWAERAAMGRFRLAMAAHRQGDRETARRWFAAVVEEFPDTSAAVVARKALESSDSSAPQTDATHAPVAKIDSD